MENLGDKLRLLVDQKKQQEKDREEQERKSEKERLLPKANNFCKIVEEEVLPLIVDPMRRAAEDGFNIITCSIFQYPDKSTTIHFIDPLSNKTTLRIPVEKYEVFERLFWLHRADISDHVLYFFAKKYKLRCYKEKNIAWYDERQMDITFNWGKNDKNRTVDDDNE